LIGGFDHSGIEPAGSSNYLPGHGRLGLAGDVGHHPAGNVNRVGVDRFNRLPIVASPTVKNPFFGV
jgi:hypothetical protein